MKREQPFARQPPHSVDFPGKEEAKRRLSLLEDGEGKGTLLASNETKASLKEQAADPLAQVRLGELYEKQGAFAQAEAAYEKAINLNPSLLSATAKLAQLYAGPLQDNVKALKFAKKARELAPYDKKIMSILGRAAYQAGDFNWAYSLLQESARELPNDPGTLHQLAWSAYSLGRVKEAREAMQRLLAAAPDSTQAKDAKSFLTLMTSNHDGTNPSPTKAEVDQILQGNPGYIPALMARAGLLVKSGEQGGCKQGLFRGLKSLP